LAYSPTVSDTILVVGPVAANAKRSMAQQARRNGGILEVSTLEIPDVYWICGEFPEI